MKKTVLFMTLLCLPLAVAAQNPVISGQFTADPTARVFNNRVYLFPSHDIVPPEGQRQDWFCMADYHVFSSENLTEWTDHGIVISQESVPWGNPQGYSMWAPDCVCKDGKYYFFYPNAPREGRGFAIGVATASKPEGPYTCEPQPIKGVMGIDPCVLVDNDGAAYLYWSGMGIRGAKLKDNMLELDGELQEVQFPKREGQPEMPPMKVGGEEMKGLPDGFKEGPFAFRRGDWYYLTFPWVRGETGEGKNPTETLAYAMSKSPLGPWDFKGIIMAEHQNHCWTNHHSIVEYKGQWYLFYHHNDYSPNDDKRRSVCIDKLQFNADGTIQEVKPTLRGVGTTKATARIEVDRYSAVSSKATVAFNDTANTFRGWHVTLPAKGEWVQYDNIDFSSLEPAAYMVVCAKANANTTFAVREKSPKGKVLARFNMTVITQRGQFRRDQSGQWLTLTASLEYLPKGTGDIVVTCEGEGVSIDWVQFKNREHYFSAGDGVQPLQMGAFIRNWLLLEPIDMNVPSNIMLSDTYLHEQLYKTYFKDQFTMLPRDGQKVKAGKQTLAWHALRSNTYNVKLFRFADILEIDAYNSLFWGVAFIDCPEEMSNVRLAVGSNGASMWWLNGDEVLTLDGDRRMVEDDGVSRRLTLKKGRNVLRFALVNGPGLSDFCVRFIEN